MKTVVLNKKAARLSALSLSLVSSVLLSTACQKSPPPEAATPAAEAPASNTAMPTGLVKNPVKHTEATADVTKWMDMASTKTAAQIAKEEKLAKEAKEAKDAKDAKEARDAKLAAEAKALASKSKIAASAVAPQVVATKPIDVPAPVVAAATPKPAPTPAPVAAAPAPAPVENLTLKVLSSVQPKYPGGAVRAGVTNGVVTARIHIETDGKVSQVDIVKANPPKHFDKEVIAAASQWKYAPISKPLTTMLEFNFKLDN
ncbi:energy transducer TonB [Undibacterium sp. TS12]|uniref:energy transducer TonB n=1 Tax=Undibacterium sp. TS12 TaxID=2908202 RepID=UPI001F4C8EDC|nr:energy transducer TonB [Undibacterium sp. TS12]MCH8619228.1 TonB family protein [Undibacterium sp. TS12]